MPLVKIEIKKGFSPKFKKDMLGVIHETIIDVLKAKDNDVKQRIFELEEDNFYQNSIENKEYFFIEIMIFSGRDYDVKRQLLSDLTFNLQDKIGINDEDLIICINEIPKEGWHWRLE